MRIAAPPLPVPPHEAAAIVCFVVAPAPSPAGASRGAARRGTRELRARAASRWSTRFPGTSGRTTTKPADFYHGSLSMFVARRLRADRDAREPDGRAQDACADDHGGAPAHARCRTRSRLLYGARDRVREPAAVLALDSARARHAVLAVRAVAAALDALRRDRQRRRVRSVRACSSRCRRAARRRGPATALAFACGLRAVVRARDAADVHCRRATRTSSTSSPTRAGALLGGSPARRSCAPSGARQALSAARHRIFLPGKLGDFGLALLALWLVAQINPGIPLFAVTFDAEHARTRPPRRRRARRRARC